MFGCSAEKKLPGHPGMSRNNLKVQIRKEYMSSVYGGSIHFGKNTNATYFFIN